MGEGWKGNTNVFDEWDEIPAKSDEMASTAQRKDFREATMKAEMEKGPRPAASVCRGKPFRYKHHF